MPNRSHLLIVLVALLAATGGFLLSRHLAQPTPPLPVGIDMLAIGDTRSDLRLMTPEGTPRHLHEWDGKLILLNFWATWCAPCVKEMPLLAEAQRAHAADGLQIVGVALDGPEAVRQFIAAQGIDYPILVAGDSGPDPSVEYGNARGVLPFSVLIGRDGTIKAQQIGDFDAKELESWLAPHLE